MSMPWNPDGIRNPRKVAVEREEAAMGQSQPSGPEAPAKPTMTQSEFNRRRPRDDMEMQRKKAEALRRHMSRD